MKTTMLRSVSLLALAFSALSASATVIDFEGLPEGNLASLGGVTFTNAYVLNAGQSLNTFNFPPYSGVGVISNFENPISIGFSSGQSSVGAYVTTSNGPLTLEAYSGAILIGSVVTPFATNNDGAAPPNYFLSISGTNITSVRFFSVASGGNTTLDDLTFSPAASAVPGPMAALPFALIALKRRKRA